MRTLITLDQLKGMVQALEREVKEGQEKSVVDLKGLVKLMDSVTTLVIDNRKRIQEIEKRIG